MICPIISASVKGDFFECETEKCAWWNESIGICLLIEMWRTMITNSEPQETIETSLRELLKAAEGCQMKIKAGLIQAKQEGINEANANLQAAHKEELERVFRELESKDEQDMTSNTFTLSESMDWYQALKRDALHFAGRLSNERRQER